MPEIELIITAHDLVERINKQSNVIRMARVCNNFSVSTIDRPLDILGVVYMTDADKVFRFKSLATLDFSQEVLGELFTAVTILNTNLSVSH